MALTPERQAEIAETIRAASTWVNGPRRAKLAKIADELGGFEPEAQPEQDHSPEESTEEVDFTL